MLGREGPALTNMMLTLNRCPFFTYDPATKSGRRESADVSKSLKRRLGNDISFESRLNSDRFRYFLVQKAKDANIIGIVFGTLGVAQYLTLIESLQRLVKRAGKKSYTFCVGKLNTAKLANFAEVDLYVMVACPETSLVRACRQIYVQH